EGAQSLTAVSSERVTLKNMLLAMRQWLGFKKTRFISIPLFLIKLTAKFGDYVPYSTVNTPAIHMLELGNTTNAAQAKKFQDLARVTPMNFSTGLQQHPASTADRWYAKLSLLRPLLRFSLVFMWLMSALTSLLPYTQAESYSLLQQVGIPLVAIGPSLYAAILLNAIIGIGLLFNYQTKINYILQAAVIIFYMLVISIKLPYLWLEPFGPIVKNIPILMSILVLYTMES
ncbi:MAG: oxidoreductase, partial [Legionella sp.]